ncbi:hypothetical protein BDZ97DRAFT_2056042 [Flammula alnicola]|nr:hypothetical protein BDZ97DRAFT_2056042 [Flammula alnicola]
MAPLAVRNGSFGEKHQRRRGVTASINDGGGDRTAGGGIADSPLMSTCSAEGAAWRATSMKVVRRRETIIELSMSRPVRVFRGPTLRFATKSRVAKVKYIVEQNQSNVQTPATLWLTTAAADGWVIIFPRLLFGCRPAPPTLTPNTRSQTLNDMYNSQLVLAPLLLFYCPKSDFVSEGRLSMRTWASINLAVTLASRTQRFYHCDRVQNVCDPW